MPDSGDTAPCSGGGTSWGMICSLSIPIVTLCAMILLIIMVGINLTKWEIYLSRLEASYQDAIPTQVQ